MKKEWRKPQLNELNVKQTKADASGRPIPVSYPGVITCHEPVSGHPVSKLVNNLAELEAFYAEHDNCPPDGFFYEYGPSLS